MAISPPSDIINDVARAADPARYQAASQKLLDGASALDGASFDDAMKSMAGQPLMASGADIYTLRNSLRNDAESASAARTQKAHQEFEAYILQTFVESMLPKDAENTYGKGNAGSIWKSMMAEQIGAQISKAGGIGIAKRLLDAQEPGRSSDIRVPPAPASFSGKV
ncbi:rod-binding protein [Microvirga mediterraneensis]|uniref:Rod-binding protein n=1 Tax=Microvirga mediterraneensis TaxID=2754695 RepID=A0A838BHH8_9HYPH|nr:rod-binding protein [Microvirga mediterraneensis]MBA1154701.1 rod-binding protein [Microvirga mediterraneensis]